eukprot:1810201-Rhodomonas_salina.2
MSGTDLADAAIRLRTCYAMSGTDLTYAATRNNIGDSGAGRSLPPSSIAYAAICLCACYAMSGSLALALYQCPGELRYAATRVLCDVRHRPRVCCYLPTRALRVVWYRSSVCCSRCPVLT